MLDPKSKSLLTLFGDASAERFYIPNFQRDFSWGSEQIEDLWNDLRNADDSDGTFLGHLILYRKNKNDFSEEHEGLAIIDGQQRLTTLSLLIAACRDHAREQGLSEHAQDLQRLLAFTDRATLTVRGLRLSVGRNISRVYAYMVEDERWFDTSFPARLDGVATKRESNRIRPLYDYFRKELLKLSVDEFIDLKRAIYACYFIVLEITEKPQAFDIFERTNARGVPLNIADLLKNLLFSLDDLSTLDGKWSEITERAGVTIQRMIKYYAVLHHGLVRKRELYKKLSITVSNLQPSGFIDSLACFSHFYKYYLDAGDHEDFNLMLERAGFLNLRGNPAYAKSVKRAVDALHFFGITQALPVIYAGLDAAQRIEEGGRSAPQTKLFVSIILSIERFHFVNNIICTNVGNDIEKLYADKAKALYHCSSAADFKKVCSELRAELKGKLEDREVFVSKFMDISYDTTPFTLSLLSYIFDRYQNHEEDGAQIREIFTLDPKIFIRDFSTDHFWEQSEQEHFDGPIELVHNIGNLNAIPRHTNSVDINGLNPDEKANKLRERDCEGLKYVRDFIDNYIERGRVWNGKEVQHRAKKMAEHGFDHIWSID